jgi:hypothetical protein
LELIASPLPDDSEVYPLAGKPGPGDTGITARSWFCVLNNPAEHGFKGTPEEMLEAIKELWIADNPQRTCAVTYCVSAEGLHHCHAVFEDTKTMRFSAVKKLFPSMHIEATKGNKEQAEDYIIKRGKWEEKGESVVCIVRHGEIKGAQGQRRDFDVIDELIRQGMTPGQVLAVSFSYRRFERMIRDSYYDKRKAETPLKRDVKVFWHVGGSGSGKSYSLVKLAEEHGEDKIYIVSDYEHGFDKYGGEPILFMDEFRSQMPYAQLLMIIDGYKVQIPCRYTNVFSLWTEVHITSILPPELAYQKMVREHQSIDTIEQLRRRITSVIYHYKQGDNYLSHEVPMSQYTSYGEIREMVEHYSNFEEKEIFGGDAQTSISSVLDRTANQG